MIYAGPLTEARVTKVINDVRIVDPAKGTHPAAIDEKIQDEIGLKTGIQSRSELLFQDDTLTRIGPETTFSFKSGTRDLNLKQGSMLLQVPKGHGGAKIRTAAITAAITGTTIMMKYSPGKQVKVLVLEGSLRLSLNNGNGSSVLSPGQMIQMRPNATRLPAPVTVDLRHIMKTSTLVKMAKKGQPDLPSQNLISNEINKQDHQVDQTSLVRIDFTTGDHGTNVQLRDLQSVAKHSEDSLGFSTSRR